MALLPIRFVLVDTSHPGNIGAAARAMKNMELGDLALVRPRQFPHPDAVARASGADDLLARARVCASLGEALEGCGLVLASTSRERDHYYRVLDVREAAERAVAACAAAPVGTGFGACTGQQRDLAPAMPCAHPTGATYADLAMAVRVVAMRSSVPWHCCGAAAREQPLAGPAAMSARAPEAFRAGRFPRSHLRHEPREPHPPVPQRASSTPTR
jgi:hypothetical protein